MNRYIDKLARKALARAAEMYRSGEFAWTVGVELLDSETYRTAQRVDRQAIDGGYSLTDLSVTVDGGESVTSKDVGGPQAIYEAADGGCLLGGIAKAAYEVAGKPSWDDQDGWLLKLDVEDACHRLTYEAIRGEKFDGSHSLEGTIYRMNDELHAQNGEQVYCGEKAQAPTQIVEVLEQAAKS